MIDWLGPIVYEYYGATEGTGTLVDSATWLARPGIGRPDTPDHIRSSTKPAGSCRRARPGSST